MVDTERIIITKRKTYILPEGAQGQPIESIGNSNGLLHRQSVPWAPRGAGSQPQWRMRSCGWTTDLGPPSSDCGAQLRSGGTAVIGGGVQ
jgi:hypothetical protein